MDLACDMMSSVNCIRICEGTLVSYVLQVVTFGFVLMFDIHAFILRANRAPRLTRPAYRSRPYCGLDLFNVAGHVSVAMAGKADQQL